MRIGKERLVKIRIPACVFLLVASFALADAPFEDLSYEAALKKAEAAEKVVMIDFYASWCPPSKLLDARTWPERNVQKWLSDHAVCIRINAEVERRLAARFYVGAYPTIIFLRPDETVVNQFVGYVEPAQFLDAANNALSGKDAYTRATEIFDAGDRNDPFNRNRFAAALAACGRREAALKHYLWCLDTGVAHDHRYAEYRLTGLLAEMEHLARLYPPALEALQKRRNDAEQCIRTFITGDEPGIKLQRSKGIVAFFDRLTGAEKAPIVQQAETMAALNALFRLGDRTIQVYDLLKTCDRKHSDAVRRTLYNIVEEDLLKAHRYADIVRYGNPVKVVEDVLSRSSRLKTETEAANQPGMQTHLSRLRIRTIGIACDYFEACTGADRMDLAVQIKDKLLDYETSLYVYETLLLHAAKAKRYEVVLALGDEAKTKLDADDAETIRHRVKANLKSPEARAALEKLRQTANAESKRKNAP